MCAAPITATRNSPHAIHTPVPVDAVQVEGGIPQLPHLRQMILGQHQHLVTTNRLRNFERVAGTSDAPFDGLFFNDSDVYKWLEAAAWLLAQPGGTSDEFRNLATQVIATVKSAQDDNGYLNTWFSLEREHERWSDLEVKHELYCAGHLIQAAVAHHRATSDPSLLEVATRFADLICDQFGPDRQKQTDGHPEIELALIELFRETGNQQYLNQARFFIDVRGHRTIGGKDYHQDKTPARDQTRMVGHAVRHLYLNAGIADLLAEYPDPQLKQALDTMWNHMWSNQAYVTGGLGSRWEGEAFGNDYELPNDRAYTETCAAIAGMMWAWRMQLLSDSDSTEYMDAFEHLLYNAMLPGLSLDATEYFYQNPLEDGGSHRRTPWFGCACCPPNVARTLAQLGGYQLSTTDEGSLWVHAFLESASTVQFANGDSMSLRVASGFPFNGTVTIHIETTAFSSPHNLVVRIPGWARGATVWVNGEVISGVQSGTYLRLQQEWNAGDSVVLHLPMDVRRVVAHPRVAPDTQRVALQRGPLVYCLEAVDHGNEDVRNYVLSDAVQLSELYEPDLLGGTVVLRGDAQYCPAAEAWDGQLYRDVTDVAADTQVNASRTLSAIPYFLWANRAAGAMTVWIRRQA